MNVKMYLDDSADELIRTLQQWLKDGHANMMRTYELAGFRWHAEIVKRVPIRTGRLKNAIMHSTKEENGEIVCEVGTNVGGYANYVEYGTKYIAGGRVLALGPGPEITDADAIHNWPAKAGEATDRTAVAIDINTGRRVNNKLQDVGGPQEQMPFIRPAFQVIKAWLLKEMERAMEPPNRRSA